MQVIIRLTNEFILKEGINRLPVRFETLKSIFLKYDYIVASYKEANDIIEICKLRKHTKYNAFMFVEPKNNIKMILYKDELSTSDKLFSLAHELGHIVLGHTYCGVLEQNFKNTDQEREANIFALQLLAPTCVLKAKRIKSVEDIQKETLLDQQHAKDVFVKLKTKGSDPLSREMVKAFYMNKDRAAILLPRIAVGIITVLLIISLYGSIVRINDNEAPDIVLSTTNNNLPETTLVEPTTTTMHEQMYKVIVNRNTGVYHLDEECQAVGQMNEENKIYLETTIEELNEQGYRACKFCGKRRWSQWFVENVKKKYPKNPYIAFIVEQSRKRKSLLKMQKAGETGREPFIKCKTESTKQKELSVITLMKMESVMSIGQQNQDSEPKKRQWSICRIYSLKSEKRSIHAKHFCRFMISLNRIIIVKIDRKIH